MWVTYSEDLLRFLGSEVDYKLGFVGRVSLSEVGIV